MIQVLCASFLGPKVVFFSWFKMSLWLNMSSTVFTVTSGALQNLYFLSLYCFKSRLFYRHKYDTRKHSLEVIDVWDLVQIVLFPHNAHELSKTFVILILQPTSQWTNFFKKFLRKHTLYMFIWNLFDVLESFPKLIIHHCSLSV